MYLIMNVNFISSQGEPRYDTLCKTLRGNIILDKEKLYELYCRKPVKRGQCSMVHTCNSTGSIYKQL